MDYNITNGKNWHTVIDVTIPPDSIKPKLDENFKAYQANAKIGGFRKGKVPMQLVKKMFGAEIEQDTFRPHITEAWQTIFKDNPFENAINEPYITDLNFDNDKGLTFNIEFDVRPEFEVKGYGDVKVEKITYDIKKDDVDNALEEIRERQAMVHTVEGEAQEGNFLLADLQEVDEGGVPVVGSKYPDQQVWLSKENVELTTQLLGVKAGEDRKITLTLPSQEEGKEGEEKKQDFLLTVKEIKERRVPDLDDEFAKDVGPYKNLKELKDLLKKNITAQAEMEARVKFESDLVDGMVKKVEIEAPPSMVNNYLGALIGDFKKRNKDQKVTDEQLIEYYKPTAERTIQWMLLREKIIEQESILVSEDEIEAKIKELEASENEHDKQHAQEYRDDENAKRNLEDRLLEEKVYAFLESKVKVSKVKKGWREVEEPQEAEQEAAKEDSAEESADGKKSE